MPLNNSYDEQAVIQAIASALETFYGTLIEKIDALNIQKVMKRKKSIFISCKSHAECCRNCRICIDCFCKFQ